MSIRAMNWAMEQATGDPRAQCLLYVVADAANEEGIAWPSADWMAKKSQQSRATVYRRLSQMQEVGLLVMFPRYIDSDGKIFTAAAPGRRRTSPEIRLQFGVFIKNDSPADDAEEVTESDQGQSQAETTPVAASDGGVAPVRRGSSHCGDSKNHLLNQEENPPTPLAGGVPPDDWSKFETAWVHPITRVSICQRLWSAFTEDERAAAAKAASGYNVWRNTQQKPPHVINPQTFLRERDAWSRWGEYAEKAAAAARPIILVDRDTDAGRAFKTACLIAGCAPRESTDGQFILRAEPSAQMLALARAPDWKQWKIFDAREQCGAWGDLLLEVVGSGPRVDDHIVGKNFTKDARGNEVFIGNQIKRGFKAPWPWPPKRDGSVYDNDLAKTG